MCKKYSVTLYSFIYNNSFVFTDQNSQLGTFILLATESTSVLVKRVKIQTNTAKLSVRHFNIKIITNAIARHFRINPPERKNHAHGL